MIRLSKTLMVLQVAAGLSGLAIQARAADPVKPDVNRGQAIAVQVCASCHGADGNSAGGAYPKLAGQHSDYIYWALRQYQMGNGNPHFGRNNPIMQAQVQSLSQSDMKDIAAYIESLDGDLVQKK